MQTIFVLANGRSGTKFLSEIFRINADNCISRHEPFPDMFNKPIYWYQNGEIEKIKEFFLMKKKRIDRVKKDFYIETNHAFLKSFSDIAIEFYPDMKLLHLIRNPLVTVRSLVNKYNWDNGFYGKIVKPFIRHYRGSDKKIYFRWALTGKETIFKNVSIDSISLFQKYALEWIEIENRAINFLNKYKKNKDCFNLHTSTDLNNINILEEMFNFLGISKKEDEFILKGNKNQNYYPTKVSKEDKIEFQNVINSLPDKYLKIFQRKPYNNFDWCELLKKS